MDDKEIEFKIKKEASNFVPNNFNAVKDRLKLSPKYIEASLKKELKDITPDKYESVKPKVKLRIFTPQMFAAVGAAVVIGIATPIIITVVQTPVAYCSATVLVETSDDSNNTITYRVTVNESVTVNSVDENGSILLTAYNESNSTSNAIKYLTSANMTTSFENVVDTFTTLQKESDLVDSEYTTEVSIIAKNENELKKVKDACSTRNFSIKYEHIMNKGSELKVMKDAVTISDTALKLFRNNSRIDLADFEIPNLVNNAEKGTVNLNKLGEEYGILNKTLQTKDQIEKFNNDLNNKPFDSSKPPVQNVRDSFIQIGKERGAGPKENDYFREDIPKDYWRNKWDEHHIDGPLPGPITPGEDRPPLPPDGNSLTEQN